MAVIDGFKSGNLSTRVDHAPDITGDLDEYGRFLYPYSLSEQSPSLYNPISGKYVPSGPRVIQAFKSPGFDADYLGQIHIFPAVANLGAITGNSSIEIEIFNAFNEAKSLSSIGALNDDGLSLSGISAPIIINPNQSMLFFVNASVNGPPQISASYTFNFIPPILGVALSVLGTRVVTFPYRFSDPLKETLSWMTKVITAKSGNENRIRLRRAPRQKISGSSFISATELIRANNLFYNWRDKIWAVPVWFESIVASTPINANDTVISVDTTDADFRVDGLCLVWESNRKLQTFEIASLTASQITSKQPITSSYVSAVIAPVRSCKMTSDPTLKSTGYNGDISFSFESLENIELLSSKNPEPFSDGIEAFEKQPLSSTDTLSDVINSKINTINYKTGVTEFFSPWMNKKVLRKFSLLLENKNDIWEMREWLHRRAGKAIPFYMPSFQNDMQIVNVVTIGSSINVLENDHIVHGAPRDHIALLTFTSGWVYAQITSINFNGDGTETLVLGSTLNIEPSDIRIASYAGLKRLSSDDISITWRGNGVAELSIQSTEIMP